MTDQGDRFRRLSELFDEVVALPDADREARIAEGCAEDPGLEAELRRLLAADEEQRSRELLREVISSEAEAIQSVDVRGLRLGSWRLLESIGEGGMGTVYLAERADGAYDARAAVKLVRGGIPSPLLAERFRAERQILAGLSHPGVARLLDGGSTPDGTPYLVMEYIEGAPITDWCDSRELGVEERLRLFVRVCDSVAYAHRELVAHRDLKPSNILVTPEGEPKLLDFGIAKLMDAVGEGGEGVTQTYGVMTPAYASPEQVSGERAGVAADTYSLGVLLYQLLSGRLPIETRGLTPPQLITRVTQEVPPVVSSAVPGAARRRLEGDLDAIVSRALRKEPEARYASVDALAEDIRLHLDGMPIRVRNDDWRYRTGKLVRRNAGVVSGGVLVLLLGLAFTFNAVVQARAVARERDRAEAQRATAERVSAFLEELFTEVDPNATSSRDITLRDVLDRGAERVMVGLADEPETRAALATVMGRVYNALGEHDAARPVLDTAVAVRRAMLDADPVGMADAYLERGVLEYSLGQYEPAIEWFDSSLVHFRRADGEDSHELAGAMAWLAVAHVDQGNLDEAVTIMRDAVGMHRRVEEGPNEDIAVALKSLQDVLREAGQIEEAVQVGLEALSMSRDVYGNDHLETAHALNQLGSSLNAAGRSEEAIPLVQEGLAIRRAAFDGAHVEVAASLGNLANMLSAVGREVDAIGQRRASVAMLAELFPPDHPYVAGTTASLGTVLLRADSLESAEPVLVDGLRFSRMAFPERHPNIATPLASLGTLYRRTGRLEASLDALSEALAIRVEGLPADHWNIGASRLELGRTLDALERDVEAEAELLEAYRILDQNFGGEDGRTRQARDELRAHYERRGLSERAADVSTEGR